MFLPYQLFLSRIEAQKTRFTPNAHHSQGFSNERGAILTVGLAFLAVLALLGTIVAKISMINTQPGGHYKTTTQVFNKAEAGTGEARARLRGDAYAPISDNQPTQSGWRVYIGDAAKAQEIGYVPNDVMHDIYSPVTFAH